MGLSIIKKKGISLIEAVLAIAMFSIFSTGVLYLSMDIAQSDEKTEESSLALLYAQEGIEALRQMRDRNYFSLEEGDHGLSFNNEAWSFIPAPEDIDGFYSRTVAVEDVYRDVDGNITSVGGSIDHDTKKITSRVDWQYRRLFPRSVELETYLSNWTGDDWIQTDCNEFDEGSYSDMTLEFLPAPPDNNCALKLSLIEEENEFYASANVGAHANDVWVEGNYAYAAVSKSNEGLAIIDISDKNNPVIVKKVNVGEKGISVTKSGNYVYVAVDSSLKGLAVVDVSNPANASVVAREYVLGKGYAVEVSGNYLYMGISTFPVLVSIDISNPVSPSLSSFFVATNNVYDIRIVGNYAYCGVDDDWFGFQIFDVSNPSAISLVSLLSVGEEVNTVVVQGHYAFLGTEKPDDSFYVVNISDPETPFVEAHINTQGEIQGLAISGDYIYAAIDETNRGLASINISTPTNPYLVYVIDINGKATGIKSDGEYLYATINVNNRGIVILGTTIVETVASGYYLSQTYDTGSSDTRYNFVEWDSVSVPGGSVKLQIRTASTENGLASANFVGSDGTVNTYYESSRTPIVLDPGASGVRFVQFKVYIDSDGASSPLVESVKINYTP